MTISQTSFLTEILDGKKSIPVGRLSYFRERQRNRLYDLIITRFMEKEKNSGFSKADLARRLNKRPEQITRLLSTPGNWTLNTLSDLMLAICEGELEFSVSTLNEKPKRNSTHSDVLGTLTNLYESNQQIEKQHTGHIYHTDTSRALDVGYKVPSQESLSQQNMQVTLCS